MSESATLVSVNVGLPKNVDWHGKSVYTGIYKTPVEGPVLARRLNLDGDGQGDLGGHGGEQRAVLVYQTESYAYWADTLGRDDLQPGSFGENFTVSGLSDAQVCIGDRYRIGEAEFEVTQPRVTCFRVGLRLGEPQLPNLLVAHHRPGFYLRVITEGAVRAGDPIVRTRRGRHQLSVADVDALLYLPGRDQERLRDAVDIPALSPGWQQSFHELLEPPPARPEPLGWNGFRELRVAGTRAETDSVLSIELADPEGVALPPQRPGQFLTLRLDGAADPAPLRSYSLSGYADAQGRYRISVKRDGVASRWIHAHLAAGVRVAAAAPRGDFVLGQADTPVVLLSAGIGATPVLAMLHALATERSQREVWWVHTTRDAASEAFAAEIGELLDGLPHAHRHVVYTVDGGRLDATAVAALALPTDADAYLCGPQGFMTDMRAALTAAGIDDARVHTELFGALPAITPGIAGGLADRPPHAPDGPPGSGPEVSFARSGLTVPWSDRYGSLLEFAEACDVPTRFSCRSGVCHMCATPLIAGETGYRPEPLDPPTDGTVLICSAQPRTGVVLDL
jgi:ferredoxin-NADP reductase/MOSC domain-containing protein YiiM/ferredoxin